MTDIAALPAYSYEQSFRPPAKHSNSTMYIIIFFIIILCLICFCCLCSSLAGAYYYRRNTDTFEPFEDLKSRIRSLFN